jgi:uncharacterized protein (DUF1697 family)
MGLSRTDAPAAAMTRRFAFLRAINVGGRNVTMDRLRAVATELGLASVESFIASGNLVFESDATDRASLERAIEEGLRAALGYPVATFVRDGAELAAIAAARPFDEADMAAARAYNVAFLAGEPGAEALARLGSLETEIDRFAVLGREAYWLCRVRQSESRFNGAALEKALGGPATLRGMNTVQRMVDRWGLGRAGPEV